MSFLVLYNLKIFLIGGINILYSADFVVQLLGFKNYHFTELLYQLMKNDIYEKIQHCSEKRLKHNFS